MFKNVSPDLVWSGRTRPANLGVRSCPVSKLICPVRLSPKLPKCPKAAQTSDSEPPHRTLIIERLWKEVKKVLIELESRLLPPSPSPFLSTVEVAANIPLSRSKLVQSLFPELVPPL